MSSIQDITSSVPRNKKSQRKGRGESSGRGKTSGRGNKGSKARVGTYIKRGYEGGQTPIFRRFPKRGFSNHDFERDFYIVNVEDLNGFAEGTIVDQPTLVEAGLVPDDKLPVKILGNGQLTRKLTIQATKYSKSAFELIGKTGGIAQTSKGEVFAFPKPKKKFIKRDPVKKAKGDEAGAEAPKPESGKAEAPKSDAPKAE